MKNADKPAYPSINPKGGAAWNSSKGDTIQEPAYVSGLTKREMFAMSAMQGLLAGGTTQGYINEDLTKQSIEIADDLLKQLES